VTARVEVTDNRGFLVRNAIVWLRGIPVRRILPVTERRTDANGIATFRLRPTRRLELRNGGRLVIFVRARKQGDRIVGGVTGQRMVSSLKLDPPR
jgi:antitoxin (DNA-binding transcriptional repressor) of toxin-antitoxin stability system